MDMNMNMNMKGDGHEQKVDIVDIAKAGEAVDLVPVPGVITVFDFWATWCKPCKELDTRLVDLARKHPGKIAIRKINVVDWDSKATERYLTPGGFNLPHIKVFGTDGKQRFEKSDTPVKLIEQVAKLLTR